jgi:hypothetical protein
MLYIRQAPQARASYSVGKMKIYHHLIVSLALIGLLSLLAACSSTATGAPTQVQPTVTINPSFQTTMSPVPTPQTYRCGAWSSNNAPGAYGTIMVYARLTKNTAGVAGAPATAVVHFQSSDVTLAQQPRSDHGGYVSFTLPLMGRQPAGVPATVSITFSVGGTTVQCSQAFFTPQ